MNDRLSKLRSWMKENSIAMCLFTSTENVFYLSNFYSDPHERLLGLAVFQEKEPFLICPALEKESVKNAGWEHDVIAYSDIENPWDLIEKEAKKRVQSFAKIAIEKEHMNVRRFEELIHRFPGAEMVSSEEKLRRLRMIKDEEEIQRIKKACALADYAVDIAVSEISAGKTELDIAAAIEFELKKKGVQKMAFMTTVLAGANSALPHGTPGETKIQEGDLIVLDLGVVVDGYCSDITRTVAYRCIDDKQRDIYNIVLKSQLAAIKASKPGATCAEVDLTARNIIAGAGYGEYFTHRLGHGLGISVHEYPSVTEKNSLVLEEGMVFTIEPGIYLPGIGGVRIEDDILITGQGAEVLTKYPKGLVIIP